jgi:thioredoxin 1
METLPAESFAGERLAARAGLVAVCFHARWCGYCRSFVPRFAARALRADFPFALADLTSLEDERWDTLRIEAVPTLVLYRDGKPVWRRQAPLGVGLFDADIDAMVAAAAKRP